MSTPKKQKDSYPFKFQMTMSFGQRDAIDDWRRKQPDLPSRAEAIRRLVELGMGKKGETNSGL